MDLAVIKRFIEKNRGKQAFTEHEAKGLFREAGLPVPEGIFIGRGSIVPLTQNLKYPLVAKISSAKIASKSDLHGVRTGIKDKEELDKVVDELLKIENAEGVLVEEMAPQGIEAIVGGIIDAQFGPVVMFGLGGVFVELFRDVAFALAPVKKEDALWLIKQVKGYRLLEGYRGKQPVDMEALLNIIVAVSEIIATGKFEEIDLNPVALYPHGAMLLDAKIKAF